MNDYLSLGLRGHVCGLRTDAVSLREMLTSGRINVEGLRSLEADLTWHVEAIERLIHGSAVADKEEDEGVSQTQTEKPLAPLVEYRALDRGIR